MLRFSVLLFATLSYAQIPPENLSGEPLRLWLKTKLYDGKHKTLSYSEARIAMYNDIDNRNDQVEGVYGGFLRNLSAGGNTSNPAPINAEHTVPQSFFGRSLPMRSDIHHLFPTFDKFNSRRANFPFKEIPDEQTDRWLIDQSESGAIPSLDIAGFSESANNRFEPREPQKGNTARAVFYFYTMYPNFEMSRVGDVDMFYAWHLADPVDVLELERNTGIEQAQGNRNPYVDDPSLVVLAWDIDLDKARQILVNMGKDPDLITGGGGTIPSDGCDSGPTIRALEASVAKLETTLADLRAEIARLKAQ